MRSAIVAIGAAATLLAPTASAALDPFLGDPCLASDVDVRYRACAHLAPDPSVSVDAWLVPGIACTCDPGEPSWFVMRVLQMLFGGQAPLVGEHVAFAITLGAQSSCLGVEPPTSRLAPDLGRTLCVP